MTYSVRHLPRLPAIFAVHRVAGGCWEVLGPDDDPRRPPWRRWAVIARAPAQPNPTSPPATTGHVLPFPPFRLAVDLYHIVVQYGRMREARFRETIRVRLPARLRDRLDAAAREQERTYSEVIRQALREALDREPAPDTRSQST